MKKCVETLSAWNPNIARDACMIFRRVFKPENYNLWQWWLATRICRMQKFTLYYHNVLLYFLTVYTVYSDSQFLRGNAHSKNHTFQNNDYPRFALCVKLSRFLNHCLVVDWWYFQRETKSFLCVLRLDIFLFLTWVPDPTHIIYYFHLLSSLWKTRPQGFPMPMNMYKKSQFPTWAGMHLRKMVESGYAEYVFTQYLVWLGLRIHLTSNRHWRLSFCRSFECCDIRVPFGLLTDARSTCRLSQNSRMFGVDCFLVTHFLKTLRCRTTNTSSAAWTIWCGNNYFVDLRWPAFSGSNCGLIAAWQPVNETTKLMQLKHINQKYKPWAMSPSHCLRPQ